jgi:hypothetical protein
MSKYVSVVYAVWRSAVISFGSAGLGLVILPVFASVLSGDNRVDESRFAQMIGVNVSFTLCLFAFGLIGYDVWQKSRSNYYGPWMIRIFLTSIFLFIGLWLLAPGLPLPYVYLFLTLTMVAPVYITLEA